VSSAQSKRLFSCELHVNFSVKEIKSFFEAHRLCCVFEVFNYVLKKTKSMSHRGSVVLKGLKKLRRFMAHIKVLPRKSPYKGDSGDNGRVMTEINDHWTIILFIDETRNDRTQRYQHFSTNLRLDLISNKR